MSIQQVTYQNKLAIFDDEAPNQKPLFVDFSDKRLLYRIQKGGGLKEDLAKAVGVKGRFRPTIVDCTAGLGRDAFVLAALGCDVLMIEKHPVVGALLEDGLARGMVDPITQAFCQHLTLQLGDADQVLASLNSKPHTIYLDPMFPPRDKSAKVKKEMQWLQKLVGKQSDASKLLDFGLKIALKRVVVKRPIHAPPLNERQPQHTLKGKANRFDIYFIN